MLKSYVEYFFIDAIRTPTVMEVKSRSPEKMRVFDRLPYGSIVFRFFDQERGRNGIQMGERINVSAWYVFGVKLSAEKAKLISNDVAILVEQMQKRGYNNFVKTASGQIFPLGEKDVVLNL